MIGWGTFDIPVVIYFQDGTMVQTGHTLQFDT